MDEMIVNSTKEKVFPVGQDGWFCVRFVSYVKRVASVIKLLLNTNDDSALIGLSGSGDVNKILLSTH